MLMLAESVSCDFRPFICFTHVADDDKTVAT
jgi:hypothetical protein